MPDPTTDPGGGGMIPACLGCDHQAPPTCEMCGGTQGTGGFPPCRYCLGRGNPPANPLPPPPPMPLAVDTSALGTWRGVVIEPEDGEADSGKPTESGE